MRLPALQKVPALQPTEFSDVTQRAVNELLREGESKNTIASYKSALRYWAAWYGIRYGGQIQLPVPSPCVLQFIVDHAERTTDKGLVSELPALIDQTLVRSGPATKASWARWPTTPWCTGLPCCPKRTKCASSKTPARTPRYVSCCHARARPTPNAAPCPTRKKR